MNWPLLLAALPLGVLQAHELQAACATSIIWPEVPEPRRSFSSTREAQFNQVLQDHCLPLALEYSGTMARISSTANTVVSVLVAGIMEKLCEADGLGGVLIVIVGIAVFEFIFGLVHALTQHQVHQKFQQFGHTHALNKSDSTDRTSLIKNMPNYGQMINAVMEMLKFGISLAIIVGSGAIQNQGSAELCKSEGKTLYGDATYVWSTLVPILLQNLLRTIGPQSAGRIAHDYHLHYFSH